MSGVQETLHLTRFEPTLLTDTSVQLSLRGCSHRPCCGIRLRVMERRSGDPTPIGIDNRK